LVAVSVFLLIAHAAAAEPIQIELWPAAAKDTPPTETVEVRGKGGKTDRKIRGVTRPDLTVYLAPKEKASGAAIVICPGGGYGGLAIDKEGHDVARWLNDRGVAGIVLKYRMPVASKEGKPLPLRDAQRAIQLVRSRAQEWGLNADRIGIMGFSAGGHLASTAGTHFDAGISDAADPVDRLSCRPDFLVLIYPVVSMDKAITHRGSRDNLLGAKPDPSLVELYSNELQVTAQTPSAFLVHAKDDGVKVENSIRFDEAMKKAGVPSELNLFEKGGHAYGLGVNGGEVATWPQRFEKWLERMGLLIPG
jgi:acetyl esterase/lipase